MITNRSVCKFFKDIVRHEKLKSGFWCKMPKPAVKFGIYINYGYQKNRLWYPDIVQSLFSMLMLIIRRCKIKLFFYGENIVILFDEHKVVYLIFFVRWLRCHCWVVIRTKRIQTIVVITNLCTAAGGVGYRFCKAKRFPLSMRINETIEINDTTTNTENVHWEYFTRICVQSINDESRQINHYVTSRNSSIFLVTRGFIAGNQR